MSLLNNGALWALAAIAIPIIIHLLNRIRGRETPFAANRFLDPTPTRQLRSIKLTERLLLAARISLLALLALLLAQPVLSGARLDDPVILLIAPQASAHPEITAEVQQLESELGVKARRLQPDFQPWSPNLEASAGNAWALLSELQATIDADSLLHVVIGTDEQDTLWRRPDFQHNITWHQLESVEQTASAINVALTAESGDRPQLRAALDALARSGMISVSDQYDTAAAVIHLGDAPCPKPAGPQLVICEHASGSPLASTFPFAQRMFDITIQDDDFDGVPYLTDIGGRAIATLKREGDGAVLTWHSTFERTASSIVDSAVFPDLINHLLAPAQGSAKPAARYSSAPVETPVPQSILGILIALMLLAERYLALRKAS